EEPREVPGRERRDEHRPDDSAAGIGAVEAVQQRGAPAAGAVGDELVQPDDQAPETDADHRDAREEYGPRGREGRHGAPGRTDGETGGERVPAGPARERAHRDEDARETS